MQLASPSGVGTTTARAVESAVASDGHLRSGDGETALVGPGDCFMQPAGTRHRVRNASPDEDLVYYVIANEVEGGETTIHEP